MTDDVSDLPRFDFERGSLAGRTCFEQWSDILSTVFDVTLPERGADDAFDGAITTYHLGGFLIADTAGSAVNFQRSGATIARTAVEHVLVQVYLEGGFAGTAGGRAMEMRAGDVCVLDLSRPLATQASAFRNITVVMPRASLAPLVKSPDALHGVVLPGNTGIGALLGDHLCTLYAQLGQMSGREAQVIAGGTAHLIAACLGPSLDARERSIAQVHAVTLERIQRFIDERLEAPGLHGDAICRTFGLSRSSLYRLFEPHGGLLAYIRRRRLARAFAELMTPRQGRGRVLDVALRWGFGSEASFSRAFRAAYGMSPSEAGDTAESLRRLLAPEHAGTDAGAAERLLRRWMHSLYAG